MQGDSARSGSRPAPAAAERSAPNWSGPDRRHAVEPDLERLREQVRAHMAAQGLRSTEQRRQIVETFLQTREHITIDQLLALVKADDPRIGYATVYRTMKMLTAAKVAHERRFSDGFTRYELAVAEAHHDHLICLDCGRIIEYSEPGIEALQDQIARGLGFAVRYHKHELYCACLDANCPHRPRPR
ncbi:MAG TPA: Fur family transcriptional regulator [Polyangiaceae bacterium]|nr:Fur family transcriptional regulator [Polyangiaceae bacterium]